MPGEGYRVTLENVYEGPMDLLIHLIKKNRVDIYDIPIALITDQYLAYLEWMTSLNIDLAGDFLLMASTLMHIKSRMLLPVHEACEQEEDPRQEIVRPLQEYMEMKSAAEKLLQRNILGETTFIRKPVLEEKPPHSEQSLILVSVFELMEAFQKILENVSPEHRVDLTAETISVKDRISQIIDILEQRGTVAFDELFSSIASKSDIVITFLAILEMAKLNLIRIAQHFPGSTIRLFYSVNGKP
jgi:segregation and condensation protein A